MEIFVLRHGHAEADAPKDSLRALSARGQLEVQRMIDLYHGEMHGLERVLISPYLRAQQTAAIALSKLPPLPHEDCSLLVPNADPDKLIAHLYHLREQTGLRSVLLVSHQPLVGTLVDTLCGLEQGNYRMGTSALAAIDAEVLAAGCASLRWLHNS